MRRPHCFSDYIAEHGFYTVYLVTTIKKVPVKVGIARDPARRLVGLQTAHFDQLQFHRFWWLPGRPIAVRIEKAFKKNFAPAAIRGEWFDVPLQAAETFIAEMIRSLGTWSIDQNDMVTLMEQYVQHRMERSFKRIRAGEPSLWKLNQKSNRTR